MKSGGSHRSSNGMNGLEKVITFLLNLFVPLLIQYAFGVLLYYSTETQNMRMPIATKFILVIHSRALASRQFTTSLKMQKMEYSESLITVSSLIGSNMVNLLRLSLIYQQLAFRAFHLQCFKDQKTSF